MLLSASTSDIPPSANSCILPYAMHVDIAASNRAACRGPDVLGRLAAADLLEQSGEDLANQVSAS